MLPLIVELACAVLIGNLDAPRFRDREAAQRTLAGPGEFIRGPLKQGAKSPSLEIAARCRHLLALVEVDRHKRLWRRAGTMGRPWLYLDGCYYSVATWGYVEVAHAHHGCRVGDARDDWEDYRVATRVWIFNRLLADATEDDLATTLRGMDAAEVNWRKLAHLAEVP